MLFRTVFLFLLILIEKNEAFLAEPDPGDLSSEISALRNTVSDLIGRINTLHEIQQCGCNFLQSIAKCPDGWTERGNSCYFFGVIPETWGNATVTCERLGGHLAVIEDADEDAFVAQFIKSWRDTTLDLSHGYTWLGGYDFLHDGKWLWITGKPFNYTNWRGINPNNDHNYTNWRGIIPNNDHNYTNWRGINPNNDHNEDCLDYSGGGWNDHVCTEKCNFVCERRSIVIR